MSQSLNPLAPPFPANSPEYLKQIVKSDFSNLIKGDPKALSNIVELNLFLLSKVEEYEARIISIETSSYAKRISNLEYEFNLLNEENVLLKQKLAQTEDATRLLYLRLEGLQEAKNENIINNVATTLSRTGIQCNANDIDFARRIGKFKRGSTRPVLIRFFSESKRNSVLYNRSNLNKNAEKLIWINDDVSDLTRRNRKITRDVATLAKQQGIPNVRVHGDGILIEGHKYKHRDLDLLPDALSVGNAKTRAEDEDIYFQSESSYLSNFYPCKILDPDGTVYNCAEQAFQHKKAIACECLITAEKIMRQKDPYEMKRLANQITITADWISQEESIMSKILSEKFKQNDKLCALLIDTGSKQLHEASNDSKWAMGAELSSKAVAAGTWNGSDLMGRLLEGVRASITGDDQLNDDDIPPLEGDDDQVVDDYSPMPDEEEDHTSNPDLTGTSVLINTSTPSRSPLAVPSQPTPPRVDNQSIPATSATPTTTTIAANSQKTSPTAPPPRPPPPAKLPPHTKQQTAEGRQRPRTGNTTPVTRSKLQESTSNTSAAPTRPIRNKTQRQVAGKDK